MATKRKVPAVPTFTIDPTDFDERQWVEMYYSTIGDDGGSWFVPENSDRSAGDQYNRAEKFKASEEEIRRAVKECRERAESIRNGDLGESESDKDGDGVDIDDWADEIDGAASVLEDYIQHA